MKKFFYVNLAVLMCMFSVLISCKSTAVKVNNKSVPSDVTAESVLDKTKSKMFVPMTDNQVKTFMYEASYTIIGDRKFIKKRAECKI